MPSVLSILGASVDSALAEAIAANSPNFHRTFDFVTQTFPWVADGEGQSHPWTDDAEPKIDGVAPGGFVLAADGTIVTRADVGASKELPAGPYKFAATVRLTTGDGSAKNPFFDRPAEDFGILSVASAPVVTPDLAFTVPEVHGTPADLATGVNPGPTGKNVIVGIIDFGFDFTHPNFLQKIDPANPVLATRLLALWDQNDLGANFGVNTALDQLKGGGWASGVSYANTYIYSPTGTFTPLGGTPWNGGKAGIDDQLKQANPYAGYYDPHDNYFTFPMLPSPPLPHSPYFPDTFGAHGTHVSDIAVGNGAATGRPGVAPEADIVFVQLRSPASSNGPADSSSILDAVRFIAKYAKLQGKRAAINICANTNLGSHDANDLTVAILDKYPAGTWESGATDNVPIIISAGNQFVLGREPIKLDHEPPGNTLKKNYRETLAQRLEVPAVNGSNTVSWVCRKNDPTRNSLQIWYRMQGANETVEISVSSDVITATVTQSAANAGLAQNILIGATIFGRIKARQPASTSGVRFVEIELDPLAPATGDVGFTVTFKSPTAQKAQAWLQRDGMDKTLQSGIAIHNVAGDTDTGTLLKGCSLGGLACGANTIAVGAYFAPDRSGTGAAIAEFSSAGPAVDYTTMNTPSPNTGSRQPWVSAPGVIVLAARSKGGRNGQDYAVVMSGTSMAAPHVTGAVALMLQKKNTATAADIRKALEISARREAPWFDPKNLWHPRLGYGRLDVKAAIQNLP